MASAKKCLSEGCTKHDQSFGYCAKCGQSRTDLPHCVFPGCEHTQRGKGLCQFHWHQNREGRELKPFVDWKQIPCRGPLCKRMSANRAGYCRTHYVQFINRGLVTTVGRKASTRAYTACVAPLCRNKPEPTYDHCTHHKGVVPTSCWYPGCVATLANIRGLCRKHGQADRALHHNYGLDLQGWLAMYEAQGKACKICSRPGELEGRASKLHVDHCHGTGVVRGLLCGPCNRGIGLLQHDPAILASASRYLGV